MKKSRFTDSQIIEAIKRAESGLAVPELCRELGVSSATFYKWRAKYGGMDVSMMSRMKELEAENARLRKMYVEEKIKAEIVSEALEKSGEAISPPRDGPTCSGALRPIGWNHKRVYRIYRQLELNLRIKPRKRLIRQVPQPLTQPSSAGQGWSNGFHA